MGVKRPLGEENLPELSFKQLKQLDDCNQTAAFMSNDIPSDVLKIDCAGKPKSNSCEIQINGTLGSGESICTSTEDNELERTDRSEDLSQSRGHKQLGNNINLYASGSFSFNATSDEEEGDSGMEDSFIHTFPRYADIINDIIKPTRPPHQYLDPYVSSLNSPPKKEVPVGPDHQADLPNWDPQGYSDKAVTFLGICVVPMPILHVMGHVESAADCSCGGVGSTRCVWLHVNEARERLRESIGDKAFGDLGFYCMGEEVVACHWSADEQRLFSNVVASSRNFWDLLRFVFPSRTKRDFVSYYFNVFMLRRRAFQNRSGTVDVDSDDDETSYGDDDGRGMALNYKDLNPVEDEEEGDGDAPKTVDKGGWDDFGLGAGKGEDF